MNFGLAAATLGLVAIAELPDKTFISTIVLASRHKALAVWAGAASGLVLEAGIAVVAGRLIALLPHVVVGSVVTALFLGGAAWLVFVPESRAEEEAGEITEREERLVERDAETDGPGPSPSTLPVAPSGASPLKIYFATFGVVALAEFGDLTQVLIANLSARFRDAVSVFTGASLAFIAVSGAGVLVGHNLVKVMPLSLLRRISGALLGGLGIWSLVELLR